MLAVTRVQRGVVRCGVAAVVVMPVVQAEGVVSMAAGGGAPRVVPDRHSCRGERSSRV